jgi:hypothetical protein
MLKPMTKLDAFDLHMINGLKGPSTSYQKIFETIADEVKLPALTQVFVRGLPASEESMLKFIQNHPTIKDFNIREMHLTTGSWKNVIHKLCKMPALARLSLSNLWDNDGFFNRESLVSKLKFKASKLTLQNLVQFKRADQDRMTDREEYMRNTYPCLGGTRRHTRTFSREDIENLKAGLEFDDSDLDRQMGSPQFMRWYQLRQFEFVL